MCTATSSVWHILATLSVELEVYATHIASKVLSEALLGVDPDIAVCRELILHATANPGQEDSAVLWSTNVLP